MDRNAVDYNKKPCKLSYLKKPLVIIGSFVLCVVIYGLVFGIPVACIIIGVLYSHLCPANPKIATFLIMLGAFACLRIFLIVSTKIRQEVCTNDKVYIFKLVQTYLLRTKKKEKLPQEPQKDENFPHFSKDFKNNNQGQKSESLSAFFLMWFIPGNLWIFGIYEPNYVNDIKPDYCHPVIYLFSLYLLSICYLLVVLVVCCFIVFLLLFMFWTVIRKC